MILFNFVGSLFGARLELYHILILSWVGVSAHNGCDFKDVKRVEQFEIIIVFNQFQSKDNILKFESIIPHGHSKLKQLQL